MRVLYKNTDVLPKLLITFWQMLYLTGILVKHPEDGGKSDRNIVYFNIW